MDRKYGPSKLFEVASKGDADLLKQILSDPIFDIDITDGLSKTALWFAVEKGDLLAVKTVLEAGANVNKSHRSKQTVLMLATEKGHLDISKCLIEAGAGLDLVDGYGMTAAMISTHNNQLECLKLLISSGCNLEVKDIRGKTALLIAIDEGHLECLELLISSGASLQCVDYNGGTPLYRAVMTCQANCLKIVISAGVDLNALDRQGRTAVLMSVDRMFECFCTLVESGADINLPDRKRRTPLMIAVRTENFEALKLLIQAGAKLDLPDCHGFTALMMAVKSGYVMFVDALLKGGATTHQKDKFGKTALHIAVEKRYSNCIKCLLFSSSSINLNAQCYNGKTALMYASLFADEYLMKMLIHAGCDVNVRDVKGKTALVYLLNGRLNHREEGDTNSESELYTEKLDLCLQILLDAGAGVNIGDMFGKTPLMTAASMKNSIPIMEKLIANGANISEADSAGHRALTYAALNSLQNNVKFLVEKGANVNSTDNNGKTLIMNLIESVSSKCDMLETVLNSGANVLIQDKSGTNVFMYAIMRSLELPKLKLLLKHGADINAVNNSGKSALTLSISSEPGSRALVAFLLELGANPNIGTFNGKSPFSLGLYHKNNYVLEQLSRHKEFKFQYEDIRYLIIYNKKETLQNLIIEGFMPDIHYSQTPDPKYAFLAAAYYANRIEFLKYFLAVGYLTVHDTVRPPLTDGSSFTPSSHWANPQRQEIAHAMKGLYSQPWPLVRLCFITVSSLLGPDPERKKRIKRCPLPKKLKSMLMFREAITKLCPEHWDEIPLCPDPGMYEKMPSPRPLLYNWPCGTRVVKCKNCSVCEGQYFKFQ